MSKFLNIGGWIVAVIAIVVAGLLGQQLVQARSQLAEAVHAKTLLEANVQDLTKSRVEAKLKTDDLENKLAEAVKQAEMHETESADAGGDEIFQEGANGAAGSASATAKDEGSSNPLKAIGGMFEGEKGKAMAKMSAGMQANMQYGALFKDLKLPADVEERALAVMSAHLEAQMRAGLERMSEGKIDQKQLALEEKNAQEQLRAELSKVLSADEMAKYDQYEDEMPRHMLEQQYEMQLNFSGTSLPPESRELVKQTLVDEMLSGIPDFGKPGSNSSTNPSSVFEAQIAAIDRVRVSLSAQMDAEEFAVAERFLNQQQEQARVMQGVMGDMVGEDKKQDAPKS